MSELQADAAESAPVEETPFTIDGPADEVTEQEPEETGAELAPAEPVEAEKTTEAELEQDSVQKAINKQHRKYREEERKRLEVEAELKAAQERLSELEKPGEIQIPPMPDAWDENFEQKVKERDEAILQKARADAIRQAEEDRAFQLQQEQQLNEQRAMEEKVKSYSKRASEQGIKDADLAVAGARVAESGISPEVADFLLTDSDGPMMVAYLADEANTLELYELANLPPIVAGVKLNEIRQKAAAMKEPAPSAPEPPETISGKGHIETESPLLSGATFE